VSSPDGLRIAVLGATGALGSEVLAVLDERSFPVSEIIPVATDESLGAEIEFRGELYPVETTPPSLRGVDLLLLCAPQHASLEFSAKALRASVPTLDLSGALMQSKDVPLLVAGVHAPQTALRSPLVTLPTGPALAWILVLAPLARAFGLRRVVGTHFESASGGGRGGIESLSAETLALFNQQELPDPTVFDRPVAFDCLPWVGAPEPHGQSGQEDQLAAAVHRIVSDSLPLAVTAVRVPIFCGHGATLSVETQRVVEASEVTETLGAAPSVEIWDKDPGPSTRASAGRDAVLVGRVRRDPSCRGGLLLWLAADALRLAAANAVQLAEARFRLH
jgi:aspartate-semialdehyde dehydrogenase